MTGGRDVMDERVSIATVWAHQPKTPASEEAGYSSHRSGLQQSAAN